MLVRTDVPCQPRHGGQGLHRLGLGHGTRRPATRVHDGMGQASPTLQAWHLPRIKLHCRYYRNRGYRRIQRIEFWQFGNPTFAVLYSRILLELACVTVAASRNLGPGYRALQGVTGRCRALQGTTGHPHSAHSAWPTRPPSGLPTERRAATPETRIAFPRVTVSISQDPSSPLLSLL